VSFHTTITSSTPWRLTQLQNAYNFLNLALRELDRITLVPSPSPTPPSSTETSFNDIPQQHLKVAYRLIEQISTWIKNAQDQILLPSRTTFLNSLNTRFVSVHSHAHSLSLLLSLIVFLVTLFVDVSLLGISSSTSKGISGGVWNRQQRVSDKCLLIESRPTAIQIERSNGSYYYNRPNQDYFVYLCLFCLLAMFDNLYCYTYRVYILYVHSSFLRNENQHFQIIDQTQVECSLKKLDTIYALIQQAYEHCTEFEEKVVALSSMNTFFL